MVWSLDKSYIDGFINHKDGQEIKHQKVNIFNKTLNGNTKCYDLGGLIFWFVVFTNEKKKKICFLQLFIILDFLDFFFFLGRNKFELYHSQKTKNKKKKRKKKRQTNKCQLQQGHDNYKPSGITMRYHFPGSITTRDFIYIPMIKCKPFARCADHWTLHGPSDTINNGGPLNNIRSSGADTQLNGPHHSI